MNHNYVFRDVSQALPELLVALEDAPEVDSRAGRTRELTNISITLAEPWRRELLVPHRFPNIAAQIAETMWVLAGRKDMFFLSRYLPRAMDFSDDGTTWRAGYGKRLRKWPKYVGELKDRYQVDQLAYVVDLLRRDPLSRRAVMSIWDPVVDTRPGKDIPCNDWLVFSNRLGKLDLLVGIRSNDIIWGWSGINAFEWSALLEIVAGLVGVEVGKLHFVQASFHIYDKHWEKSQKIITADSRTRDYRDFKGSPRFDAAYFGDGGLDLFNLLLDKWFLIENRIRTATSAEGWLRAAEEVNSFPEPMLQSWLRVIQWWWSGDRAYLAPLDGTRLDEATRYSVQPEPENLISAVKAIRAKSSSPTGSQSQFIQETVKLHNEKHAAYGDSWKRRGEMLGIMANIARKIDRLGGSETVDESSADTAADLFVYLAKYLAWLEGGQDDTTPHRANGVMYDMDWHYAGGLPENDLSQLQMEDGLRDQFEKLESVVYEAKEGKQDQRAAQVTGMLKVAYRLARRLWEEANRDEYRGAVDPSEAKSCHRCGSYSHTSCPVAPWESQ